MLTVFETTTGEQDGQVLGRVAAAITEVAAEEDRGAVEQVGIGFLGLLELREKIAHGFHRLLLDDLKLRELAGILAVM